MRSDDLIGFSDWCKWVTGIAGHAPNKPGVYAFKLARGTFGRIKGKSDLVYLGCTEGKRRTLRDRLRNHSIDRTDKEDVGHRLHKVKRDVGDLEVAWKTSATSVEAKQCEHDLLARYLDDHIEFPPLNRKESGKAFRKALEALQELAPDKRRDDLAAALVEKLRQPSEN